MAWDQEAQVRRLEALDAARVHVSQDPYSEDAVLAVKSGETELDLGVAGPHPAAFEVRPFFPKNGVTVEDPVTGSLNASLAA